MQATQLRPKWTKHDGNYDCRGKFRGPELTEPYAYKTNLKQYINDTGPRCAYHQPWITSLADSSRRLKAEWEAGQSNPWLASAFKLVFLASGADFWAPLEPPPFTPLVLTFIRRRPPGSEVFTGVILVTKSGILILSVLRGVINGFAVAQCFSMAECWETTLECYCYVWCSIGLLSCGKSLKAVAQKKGKPLFKDFRECFQNSSWPTHESPAVPLALLSPRHSSSHRRRPREGHCFTGFYNHIWTIENAPKKEVNHLIPTVSSEHLTTHPTHGSPALSLRLLLLRGRSPRHVPQGKKKKTLHIDSPEKKSLYIYTHLLYIDCNMFVIFSMRFQNSSWPTHESPAVPLALLSPRHSSSHRRRPREVWHRTMFHRLIQIYLYIYIYISKNVSMYIYRSFLNIYIYIYIYIFISRL